MGRRTGTARVPLARAPRRGSTPKTLFGKGFGVPANVWTLAKKEDRAGADIRQRTGGIRSHCHALIRQGAIEGAKGPVFGRSYGLSGF